MDYSILVSLVLSDLSDLYFKEIDDSIIASALSVDESLVNFLLLNILTRRK